MATPTFLSCRHIFGASAHLTDNISYIDEDTIVYVAGQTVVLYHEKDKRQRFIHGPEVTDTITAFAVGTGRRVVAIAERGDHPQIHVFDLRTFRRKKNLVASDTMISKEFIAMAFSADDRFLLSISGAPDWKLTFWSWSKGQIIAECAISPGGKELYQCSFSPFDSNVVCIVGKDCVKFFRIVDNEIRPLQETIMPDHNFLCHCWLREPDDHVLAGTDTGEIVLFRAGEKLFNLDCSPRKSGPNKTPMPVTSLLSITGGFVVGSNPGNFSFFSVGGGSSDATTNIRFGVRNEHFEKVHSVFTDLSRREVVALALCPDDMRICGLTADAQLLVVPLAASMSLLKSTLTPDVVKCAISPFHAPRSIVGLDVCMSKPIFVTAGKDFTLRVWNLQTHQLDLIKEFTEEMLCCALHPTGLHVAVGFLDKVRIYHVILDDLRLCVEIAIKGCKEMAFSLGGGLLAAVNGNVISVFDFHTGEKVVDLRGHNSKVRSLCWLSSGAQLMSCGQDGFVYLWELDGAKRIGEFVNKRVMYTSVVVAQGDGGAEQAFVVGSDRMLSELQIPDLAAKRHYDGGSVLTHLALSQKQSILVTSAGESGRPGHIRAYGYPMSSESDEYYCLGSFCTRMKLTPDGVFFISADESGCVALYELKERSEKLQLNSTVPLPELLTSPYWSDETLVTRVELEERSHIMTDLQSKVEELKVNNEYQLKLKEMSYSEKLKSLSEKFTQEIEMSRHRLEVLREEKGDSEVEYLDKLRLMEEKHQNEMLDAEAAFQLKIMQLVDGYQELIRMRDAQIERLEDQRRLLVLSHERYVEEVTRDFEHRLEDDRRARIRQEEARTECHRELIEMETQLEDDIDTEIENLRRMYKEKLTGHRETTLKYKGENGIMKKKAVVMQRDLEDLKEEIRTLQVKEAELHGQIKNLEKEVSAHKKEIKSRDLAINEKEKRIFELKKKNQELDKFKFVLDFKIRELKQQVEPRQQEIARMRDRIQEMDDELTRYHRSNASLDETIGTLRERIEHFHKEIKTARVHSSQQENTIDLFRSQVQRVSVDILNPAELRVGVLRLVEVYCKHGAMKPKIDSEVEEEYDRHRKFLHQTVNQLKRTLTDGSAAHMSTNNEMMHGNMGLIEDINKQREANKALKMKNQTDIARIRQVYQQINTKIDQGKNIGFSNLLEDILAGPEKFSQSRSAQNATDDHAVDDLTGVLYRNRQRLLALRGAINELEGRRTMKAPLGALPPIESATEEKAPPPVVEETPAAPVVAEVPAPAVPTFFVTSNVVTTSVNIDLGGRGNSSGKNTGRGATDESPLADDT